MTKQKKLQKSTGALAMTHAAFDELKQELDNRINVLRKEIADEIAKARELGDLSENHAYTVAMEKKEMNENRILEIEDILAITEVVEQGKSDNFVNMGDKAEIQNLETKQKRVVVLIGTEESKAANPLEGKISIDSPIGKAILNSRIGDVVSVKLPNKTIDFKVLRLVA